MEVPKQNFIFHTEGKYFTLTGVAEYYVPHHNKRYAVALDDEACRGCDPDRIDSGFVGYRVECSNGMETAVFEGCNWGGVSASLP